MKSCIHILYVALALGLTDNGFSANQTFAIVDTGQTKCYDNQNEIIEELKGENRELIRENGSLEYQVSTLNRELDNLRSQKAN